MDDVVGSTGTAGREIDSWARVGIIAGFVACIVYPLLVFVPIPFKQLTVLLGASFGPALAVASIALGQILYARRPGVGIPLAAASNALAGALVTAMILVQLAVVHSTVPVTDPDLDRFVVKRVWDVVLGLDVAFDVFIGLGTTLFGAAMIRDARFGRTIGWSGIVVGSIVILGFNFYSFPTPPKEAGLFDPGPVTGLWYLAAVVLLWRSRRPRRTVSAAASA
jgi:hypothetical protein